MTELQHFSDELSTRISADARQVTVPPLAGIRARGRQRRRRQLAGAVLGMLAVAGGASLVAGGEPAGSREAVVAGAPAEVVGAPAAVVLDEGTDADGAWQLVARPEDRCLVLVRELSEGGACDLADPPQLREASVFAVGDETLVAGLAPENTTRVEVTAAGGSLLPAEVVAAGATYFFVRFQGITGVRSILATGAEGAVLARFDGPVLPPPRVPATARVPSSVAVDVKAPPPVRIAQTDEFGLLVAVRETPEGLEVDVDRVDMLGGQEAEDAAAARGTDVSNDYFLVNDNPRLRTYRIAPDAVVWGGIVFGRDLRGVRIRLDELRAYIDDGPDNLTLFHLDVEGDQVVGIEEQYRP